MKLLLDHCVPRQIGPLFVGHQVHSAREMGWDQLRNGVLLAAAASDGFGALVTTDKNMPYQQNEAILPITVLVLVTVRNVEEEVAKCVPNALAALETLDSPRFVEARPS